MKTYLFCNAHLDPVWLWRWEEGLSETLSTFRSAANLLDEYPELVFNHNESILYEWIEEHDPELFEKIKTLVSEGRWEIVGGWFLQPDCNMPSGESIFRQVLKGRLYFYDKFGKVPVTAINMDPFGHAQGLVQMLEKCGFRHYVNIRPPKHEYPFAGEDFIWQGYDGSRVLVHRSDKGYNSPLGKVGEELPAWAKERENETTALYLWGVGNHGGGPSRRDLNAIRALQEGGMELCHATPDDYFATLNKDTLPVFSRGLNPVAEGCYTSIIRIKQQHRKLENDLVMIEKMASHAQLASLCDYDKKSLDEAWRDLLFAEFHDALPGSCIQSVEEDTLRLLSHGLEITSRLKAKYFLALSAGERVVDDEDTTPILVYNPHPFAVTTTLDIPFTMPKQKWHTAFSNPVVYQNGVKLPCQSEKEEPNFYMDWSKRVVVKTTLPPSTISRLDVKYEEIEKRPEPALKPDWRNGKIVVPTARGEVVISLDTALVERYTVDGKNYLESGALSVEVFPDAFNAWGGEHFQYRPALGRFTPMTSGEATDFSGIKGRPIQPVRIIEDGEVETVVEAALRYNKSSMILRYRINKEIGSLGVEIRLFFAEKEKRVRLRIPTTLQNASYLGQTIFGREALNDRGVEVISQYFEAVADDTHALTIIDDGVYGSRFASGVCDITLARSAGYGAANSAWGMPFTENLYQPRMDQGERFYRFSLMGGEKDERLFKIDREAAVFNQMPYALPFCPSGKGEKPKALIEVEKDNITLSAFKQSERDPSVYIIRLFECQGKETTTHLSLPLYAIECEITFKPFEIKTFKLVGTTLTETDMLEEAVPLA